MGKKQELEQEQEAQGHGNNCYDKLTRADCKLLLQQQETIL